MTISPSSLGAGGWGFVDNSAQTTDRLTRRRRCGSSDSVYCPGVDIDPDAPSTAEGEVQIAAPPETVWTVMADLSAWPTWNSDVKSMAFDGRLEPGSTFRWKAGSVSLVSTLQVVEAPREIGWTGKTMGIHAVHVFHFEPMDGGTLASSAESFRGLIPSVLKKYSRNTLQRGIDRILASLKIEAERRTASPNG
jgi:uncharacterized protein YndB with AHSA1/START domain